MNNFPEEAPQMRRTLFPYAAKPEDVAGVIGFLASDATRFVTRQVLAVDGGWTL